MRSPSLHHLRRAGVALAVLPLAWGLAACGSGDTSANSASASGGVADELRLGYFANVTHAAALIGVQQGYLAKDLGSGTKLTTQVFNAGPDEVEANSVQGGGDVTIAPTANSDILTLFQSGDIDGAWVPEPYASTLVLNEGGHVLVDEKDLWPQGAFVTTHLIVRTEFLDKYPDTVAALLRANVESVEFATNDPAGAKAAVNAGLKAAGGKELSAPVLDRAWSELTVTYDPIAPALAKSAKNGVSAGTTATEVDLKGIYDLAPLNAVLTDQKLAPVTSDGLGKE
jgi:ABC-type nitrate/sulfonate/bicarbonate transport system substrate-binding protein